MFARMRPTVSWASPRINLDGCVLYAPLWNRRLDVAAGGTFKTLDRFYHTATVTGATWGSQGRTFDNNDDQISLGSPDSLKCLTSVSIQAWVNRTAIANDDVIIARRNGTKFNYEFAIDAANVIKCIYRNSLDTAYHIWISTGFTTVGTFVCIQFSFTYGTPASLLVLSNGVARSTAWDTGDGTAAVYDGSMETRVGQSTSGAQTFNGIIGEVLVYNRLLTRAEHQNNYLATKWRYS